MNYDIIIIGAGSMGMSAGYFLAKQGMKILLLDSFSPPHDKGSHHGDTRIIRHAYGEGQSYVPLTLRAQELWLDLQIQTGRKFFNQTGVLNVGGPNSKFIDQVISSSANYCLPVEKLTSSEMQSRWPGLTVPENYTGCYEPSSGILKSEECIRAYREAAESHGATIYTDSKVNEIYVHSNSVTVATQHHDFHAGGLIVTAGAGSNNLLSLTGLNLPLRAVRKTFAWFEANEALYQADTFPAFIFDTSLGKYYGFPSIEGSGLKVGRHDGGQTIDPEKTMKPFGEYREDREDLLSFLGSYMPSINRLKFGKTCTYTLTPDENFIIDLHPVYSHIALAAGFSGHGFKFSSVVGEILSQLMVKGSADYDISLFSLNRFNY